MLTMLLSKEPTDSSSIILDKTKSNESSSKKPKVKNPLILI